MKSTAPAAPLDPSTPAPTGWRSYLRRGQVMLDQDVQGLLIQRVCIYWVASVAAVMISSWCWQVWSGASTSIAGKLVWSIVPGAIGSLAVLPLVIADVLRASSRFVAPVHNVINALKRLQLGDAVPPLAARRGDNWTDLTERFNQYVIQRRQ